MIRPHAGCARVEDLKLAVPATVYMVKPVQVLQGLAQPVCASLIVFATHVGKHDLAAINRLAPVVVIAALSLRS